ncbi:MAG: hypothetical protein LBK45_01995 [Tannerellaceae bacterium]|jgi:hypothetical protein|nr:hypothetical protein [Tannerellaceae bacterium]
MNRQEILKMLQYAEQEAVYSFISAYAESNAEFCKQLKAAIMPGKGDDLDREASRARAESCFDFERGRGWRGGHYDFYQAAYDAASELDAMLSDADYLIEQGEYAPAAGIAMSVAEVIPRNYDNVDDSSGSLGQTFDMATECIVAILHGKQIPKKLKEEIYEWVRQEMGNSLYSDYCCDSLNDVYDAACEELGETEDVLADLDRQIEEASDYQKKTIVLRKIKFMQSRDLDTHAFIEKYLEMNAVRKIRFAQLMESGLYDEALALARKGIEIANVQNHPGIVSDWEESMLEIYLKQGDVKNILLLAEKILYESYYESDKYYQIVKTHTNPTDWTDTVERILASFENSTHFSSFAANVMVEHQMWKRLFTHCKKGDTIAVAIEQYEPHLKPYFEKEILAIYHEYVETQALVANSSAYDCVAQMLKRMRTFDGGNVVVNQLLQKYRDTYKRRRNMMAALNDV